MKNNSYKKLKFKQVGLREETKNKLDKLKIHPSEPYYQVIERLIGAVSK